MREIANPTSLVDQVYEAILGEIAEGRLGANTRLIQDDLATAYGVSRQPVQQALLLLRQHGFVRDAPKRGLVVAPLEVQDVRHLSEIRASLEGLAARLAAERGSRRGKQEGLVLIETGRGAIDRRSVGDQIEADVAFHDFIYALSGNPLVAATLAPNWHYTRRLMAAVLKEDEAMPTQIWDEHDAILAAIAAGDGEAAERLAVGHIQRASAVFILRLERQQEVVRLIEERQRKVRLLTR